MIKRLSDKIHSTVIPVVARLVIRGIAFTMRFTYVGFENHLRRVAEGKQAIYAFWHGRLLMMPFAYRGHAITILVSQHRDGELIARTVEGLGINTVRGSTTRGWMGGTKGLLKAIRRGSDIAITPDGPQGPRYRAQMGAVQLARATGLPIIPVSFSASKKKPLAAGMPL